MDSGGHDCKEGVPVRHRFTQEVQVFAVECLPNSTTPETCDILFNWSETGGGFGRQGVPGRCNQTPGAITNGPRATKKRLNGPKPGFSTVESFENEECEHEGGDHEGQGDGDDDFTFGGGDGAEKPVKRLSRKKRKVMSLNARRGSTDANDALGNDGNGSAAGPSGVVALDPAESTQVEELMSPLPRSRGLLRAGC